MWWKRLKVNQSWSLLPSGTDEPIRGKPLRVLVIELLGRGFFQGSIHAFNLAIGPAMFGKSVAVALAARELDPVVCEDGVQLVAFTAK